MLIERLFTFAALIQQFTFILKFKSLVNHREHRRSQTKPDASGLPVQLKYWFSETESSWPRLGAGLHPVLDTDLLSSQCTTEHEKVYNCLKPRPRTITAILIKLYIAAERRVTRKNEP